MALVTPFNEDGSVDYSALGKLIDHVIEGGVNYLVALGTTSEAPVFSTQEKKDVLAFIINKCNKRVPVVCGMGGNNTHEIIEQLRTWDLAGVDGILSVAPYYNRPSQEGMYRHFKAIAEATELPIILYNVPTRTSSNIAAETTIRLAKECKNIVAIKEATSDMMQCMHLVEHRPDGFTILSGDDILTCAQIAMGFDGVISVAANCYTSDFTSMVNAALDGDVHNARVLHYKLMHGMELLFAEGNPAGAKAALAEMGILKNNLRLPLIPASEGLCKELHKFIKTL